MTRSRVARLLLSLVLVLFAGVAPMRLASPAQAASDAVTWTVDHSAKVITVTVNLTFNGLSQRGEPITSSDDIISLQQRVSAIEAAIKAVWEGQRFKCYKLHVVINSRLVSSLSDTNSDESPITLLSTRTPSVRRAFFGARNSDPLSESPSDAFEPTTGSLNGSSVWPLTGSTATYGRLFGRVLGLDSTYDPVSRGAIVGATGDVMSGGSTSVSPQTMTRLIRRSTLDVSKLTCPLSADLAKGTYIVTFFAAVQIGAHFWTCDYDPPSSLPGPGTTVTFSGQAETFGEIQMLNGSASPGGITVGSATWDPRESQITFIAGTLRMQQGVVWTPSGLVSAGNTLLTGGSAPLPIEGRFDFTHTASECK